MDKDDAASKLLAELANKVPRRAKEPHRERRNLPYARPPSSQVNIAEDKKQNRKDEASLPPRFREYHFIITPNDLVKRMRGWEVPSDGPRRTTTPTQSEIWGSGASFMRHTVIMRGFAKGGD